MTERFYGPWRIELNRPVINTLGFNRARLTIAGSAGADGTYDLPDDSDTTFAMDVDGLAWNLGVAVFNSHRGYQEFETTRRATSFDRLNGMTAIVDVGEPPTRKQPFTLFYVKLRCVSTDPAIQPGHPTDLYDFTLPDR